MEISRRHRKRRRVGTFTITEGAMTPEAMGLIENFSRKWIIYQILGRCVADTDQKDYQECKASHKREPHIFQELSVGDGCIHRRGNSLYHQNVASCNSAFSVDRPKIPHLEGHFSKTTLSFPVASRHFGQIPIRSRLEGDPVGSHIR